MAYTLDPTSGGNTTISTSALAGGTTSQRYEGGVAVGAAVNIGGYELNTARITADGASTTGDQLLTTSGNDAIVWDDATTSGDQFGAQSFGFDWTSQTQAADIFQLYGGDDFVNLTSAGTAYNFSGTFYGGTGNDIIWSGTNADSLFGEGGNDYLAGGDGADSIDGGDGSDTIFGGAGSDSIYSGDSGNNTVYGGTGNDRIDDGGSGLNLTYGEDGDDYLTNSDTAFGGAGNDTIDGGDLTGPGGVDSLFGDAGNDTLIGNGGGDTLSGGSGTDLLYGGVENDTLLFWRDNSVAGGGANDYVKMWDGEAGNPALIVNYSDAAWAPDLFDGGADIDTVVLTGSNDILVLNTNDIRVGGTAQANNPNRLVGIEVVLAGAGADIVAMNDDGGSAWSTAVSIFGQAGNDFLAGGSAGDLIAGGNTTLGAAGADSDVIFGGAGNDVIWGDDLNDPNGATGGNDTLYGGTGADTIYGGGGNDYIYGGAAGLTAGDSIDGGAGDDTIFVTDSTDVHGGDGKDQVFATFTKSGSNFDLSSGFEDAGDGADRVIVTGSYNIVTGNLGASNDIYISKADGAGARSDIIDGESGNDVISTWAGADTISGGEGTDVLWGGAGSDMIFGGAGTDFIYAQEDNDTIYGGADWDMIYFGRNDANDQYYDVNRAGGAAAQENWLVVYGAFDQSEAGAGADFLLDGAGVRETDLNLTDGLGAGDMAWVHANTLTGDANDWVLEVRNTSGGTSSLTFDQRDVAGIGLWDNDHAINPFQTVQVYLWNGSTYAYSYTA